MIEKPEKEIHLTTENISFNRFQITSNVSLLNERAICEIFAFSFWKHPLPPFQSLFCLSAICPRHSGTKQVSYSIVTLDHPALFFLMNF